MAHVIPQVIRAESAALRALLDRHRAFWQRGEHGSFLRVSTHNPQSLPVGDDLSNSSASSRSDSRT